MIDYSVATLVLCLTMRLEVNIVDIYILWTKQCTIVIWYRKSWLFLPQNPSYFAYFVNNVYLLMLSVYTYAEL